jgi:hypothetical protein
MHFLYRWKKKLHALTLLRDHAENNLLVFAGAFSCSRRVHAGPHARPHMEKRVWQHFSFAVGHGEVYM